MNRYDILYILISVGIVFVGYVTLWTSSSDAGSWKKAGQLRRSAFHFSLWFMAFLLLALFSFGMGIFLLQAPFYYFAIMALAAAIAGAITVVEIAGVVIKSSANWTDNKRMLLIVSVAVLQFVFSTTIALLVKSKMSH